jgi:Flp pilus assembly protein TadG
MIRIFPRRIGKAFLRSQEANISILLSISAVPLIAAAGMAVDYGRWVTAKTELQAASDAAALAAANAYGQGNQNYAAVADDVLQENISNSGVLQTSVATQTAIDSPANTLTVNATASIPAAFMRVLGINELPLGGADLASALSGETAPTVSSSVVLPVFSDHHKGEIILVMDYSSSMTEYVGGVRKYITMRGEAKKLVEGLSQNGNNGDVKFGLVPFSHAVRVTMPRNFYRGQTNSGTMTACIDDRNYPYNTQSTTPLTTSKNHASKFFETSCSYFSGYSLNVRALSDGHAGTLAQISSMQPYGNTHIALGMETAWHLLTSNAPYGEAVDYNAETLKAVVLLTDGQQTSPGYGPNNIWSVSQAEANLATLCTNMKLAGIRVVTVSFDLSDSNNAATETRLRDCASENDENPGEKFYFNTDTNDELASAFGIIRNTLARNMYLSK